MIKATIKQLEQRANSRGFTLEEVVECIARQNADGSIVVDENHEKYPKKTKPTGPLVVQVSSGIVAPGKRLYLGDKVANALGAVGITPERVEKITGKPCGCKKRKNKLNELHKKAARFFGGE